MMPEGLLWYDNDPKRPLAEKIAQAAERYFQKYGQRANVCYVNAGQFENAQINGLRVVASPPLLPDYFWIGIAEAEP